MGLFRRPSDEYRFEEIRKPFSSKHLNIISLSIEFHNYEHLAVLRYLDSIPQAAFVPSFLISSLRINIKMHLTTLLPLFPLLAFSYAKPHPFVTRQTTTTDSTLYTYGTNISGLPLVYGVSDGTFPLSRLP
jgi:hypothetical protein